MADEPGYKWIEKTVTRSGRTYNAWFRVKDKGPTEAEPRKNWWIGRTQKLIESPVSLKGLSHADLNADKFRPGVLEHLRKDKGFAQTGTPTFASKRLADKMRENGFDSITVKRKRDGSLFLVDGSHRLQVAREKGLTHLPGVVKDHEGNVLFKGKIPI